MVEVFYRMKKSLKILFKTALALALIFAGVCLAGILWLKTGSISPLKEKILQKIPVPVAFVGASPVWSNEYFGRVQALSAIKPQEMSQAEFQQAIYSRMLEEKGMDRILGGKKNGYFKPSAKTSAEKMLADWQAKDTALRIWYFSQANLNPQLYSDADTLEKLMNEGKSFESLAQEYSKDEISKAYFGDLGYLENKDILPEILQATDTMTSGEMKKVASRQGLHIIKLEDKDNLGQDNGQRLHLKQIFLPGLGFEKWLELEIDKVKIIRLLNI